MNLGRTVFSQLMDYVPKREFRSCVERYRGNYRCRSFSCWDQFLCMAFAQLTYRESLRDIEACLRSFADKVYHMGIRGRLSRSTLADANRTRDWRIYGDFGRVLIPIARGLYADEELGSDLRRTVYALDSTVVDLCLSLCPWSRFTPTRGAIKLHTLLDIRGNIPAFFRVTRANVHDVNMMDFVVPEPGSFYVLDRAYLDFRRLYRLTSLGAWFVIRSKTSSRLRRVYSRPVDKTTGVRSDQTVRTVWFYSRQDYPQYLRRIRYVDVENHRTLTFITNNFELPALTIAELYRCRWQAELFFKWIKQHLRIKKFYGTSENAVKTQIWIALSTYLLVAIAKKRLALEPNLYTILQILSVTLFEKTPILKALSHANYTSGEPHVHNQLQLFNL